MQSRNSELAASMLLIPIFNRKIEPTIEITSTISTVGEGMPITLTGEASDSPSDIDSLITCWDIDPSVNSNDNGSASDDCDYEGIEMMHSWGKSGIYTVIFHVVDDDGARTIEQLEIEVTNQPARAIIKTNSESVYIGEEVFLDGSKSTDSPEDKENLNLVAANVSYGSIKLTAIIEQDNLLACQFHPEKSGKTGEILLRRWLESIK